MGLIVSGKQVATSGVTSTTRELCGASSVFLFLSRDVRFEIPKFEPPSEYIEPHFSDNGKSDPKSPSLYWENVLHDKDCLFYSIENYGEFSDSAEVTNLKEQLRQLNRKLRPVYVRIHFCATAVLKLLEQYGGIRRANLSDSVNEFMDSVSSMRTFRQFCERLSGTDLEKVCNEFREVISNMLPGWEFANPKSQKRDGVSGFRNLLRNLPTTASNNDSEDEFEDNKESTGNKGKKVSLKLVSVRDKLWAIGKRFMCMR